MQSSSQRQQSVVRHRDSINSTPLQCDNKQADSRLTLYNQLIDYFLNTLYQQQHNNNNKNNNSNHPPSSINKQPQQTLIINNQKIRQLFDLLVYFDKKQPLLLQTIIQIKLLQKIINKLTPQSMVNNIKSFILLIANCSTQGSVMTYMIQNQLLDQIIVKYLTTIIRQGTNNTNDTKNSNKNNNFIYNNKREDRQYQQQHHQQQQGGIQYLGSLLKATTMHINQNTYKYFCQKRKTNNKQQQQQQQIQQQQTQTHHNNNNKQQTIEANHQNYYQHQNEGVYQLLKNAQKQQELLNRALKQSIRENKKINNKDEDVFDLFISHKNHQEHKQLSQSIYEQGERQYQYQLLQQKSQYHPLQQQQQQSINNNKHITNNHHNNNPNNNTTTPNNNKQCLLLKICTLFHNCPQQLTRTTVINIVMRLLNQPYTKQLITNKKTQHYHQYIIQWGWNMCSGLKNQLKNLSQKLLIITQPIELDMYIQQLNDTIILWEDLTHTPQLQIYKQHFVKLNIYSLLIGSLNTSSLPMFNINFTFFILAKLMTVFKNLQLIQNVGELLFMKTKIVYQQKWVTTAMLKGFDIKNILSKDDIIDNNNNENENDKNNFIIKQEQKHIKSSHKHQHQLLDKEQKHSRKQMRRPSYQQTQPTDKLTFQGVNQFFLSMLKSKDQNFLFIAANLLYQILTHINQLEEKQKLSMINKFTLNTHGYLLTKLTSIFINQLKHDHPLNSLRRILQVIIFIQPLRKFNEQNSNEFVFFYKQLLTETLEMIEYAHQYHNYIVETFQYDMKWIQSGVLKCKGWKDQQLLKQNPFVQQQQQHINVINVNNNNNNKSLSRKQSIKNQSKLQPHKSNTTTNININNKLTFSTIIPQTPSQTLRYKLIKTFLLLKFNQIMIENKQTNHILSKYVEKLKQWEDKQPKPGDKLPYPLKQKFHQCKLIQEKTQIPCIIIEDDVNLILGFVEANFVKIIVNIKLKHVTPEIYTRKDKTYIRLNFNKFDYLSESIVQKSYLLIRGFNQAIQYFAVKKQNFKQKEINSIKKGLKKTLENLPDISLL